MKIELDQIIKMLKELREKKDLTQEKVGKIIDRSQKTIGRWEKGKHLEEVKAFVQLLQVYGYTIEFTQNEKKEADAAVPEQTECPAIKEQTEESSVSDDLETTPKTRISGFIDRKINDFSDWLNKQAELKLYSLAFIAVIVGLFVLAFCPFFAEGLRDPITWIAAPVVIAIQLLLLKYWPDKKVDDKL